jgi:eukaryotic translation initiation factor 2C
VIKAEKSAFDTDPQKALSWFVTRPFMVFGADVTHPVAGSRAPSVAAVVGSLTKSATRYATRVLVQERRKDKKATEMITNLQQAVKELIQDFMDNNNGFKPERLLFYRDGVSEGQFAHCLELEVPLVQKACMEIDENFRPPITYVVVQKRHNTRFFPATPGDGDSSGNILPGTVIDTEVCHPFEFDFFLNSHAGLKGTNKPAHYHVLLDQNGFGSDCLQLLTYRMCYNYLRATRSVSLVPPAYYAHLAAFRGRSLLAPEDDSDTTSQSSGMEGALSLAKIHDNLKTTMFYV